MRLELSDWDGLVETAERKPLWSGSLSVAWDVPRVGVWWQAWAALPNSLNVLQLGVTASMPAEMVERLGEEISLANQLLGGFVDMTWRAVGRNVGFEVMPVTVSRFTSSGARVSVGKVVVRTADGREFEPLIAAVEEMRRRGAGES